MPKAFFTFAQCGFGALHPNEEVPMQGAQVARITFRWLGICFQLPILPNSAVA